MTTYGNTVATMPALNEVERDLISSALATAVVELQRRADACEPGSGMRMRYTQKADAMTAVGRKIAFPEQPDQW